MQANLTSGVIYKGSDAEITVSLFPHCMVVDEFSNLTVNFFTTEGGHSICFTQDDLIISGMTAVAHIQYENMEDMEDGLIRYNVTCTIDDADYTMDMETRWYLKTTADYVPQEFVSQDEVNRIVEDKMHDYPTEENVTEILFMGYLMSGDKKIYGPHASLDEIHRRLRTNDKQAFVAYSDVSYASGHKYTPLSWDCDTNRLDAFDIANGYIWEWQRKSENDSFDADDTVFYFSAENKMVTSDNIDTFLTQKEVAHTKDIPTKTSQLTNDSNFLTEHQHLKTINGQSIKGDGNITIAGGSGDVCVCYVYNTTSIRFGDFDELHNRVSHPDPSKPYVCYFVLGNNLVPASLGYGNNRLTIYEHISGFYLTATRSSSTASFNDATWTIETTYAMVRGINISGMWCGTQTEYDALDFHNPKTLYIIK